MVGSHRGYCTFLQQAFPYLNSISPLTCLLMSSLAIIPPNFGLFCSGSNVNTVSKSRRRRAKKDPVVLEFANWEWAPTDSEILASMEPISVPDDKWDLKDYLDDTLFDR